MCDMSASYRYLHPVFNPSICLSAGHWVCPVQKFVSNQRKPKGLGAVFLRIVFIIHIFLLYALFVPPTCVSQSGIPKYCNHFKIPILNSIVDFLCFPLLFVLAKLKVQAVHGGVVCFASLTYKRHTKGTQFYVLNSHKMNCRKGQSRGKNGV